MTFFAQTDTVRLDAIRWVFIYMMEVRHAAMLWANTATVMALRQNLARNINWPAYTIFF